MPSNVQQGDGEEKYAVKYGKKRRMPSNGRTDTMEGRTVKVGKRAPHTPPVQISEPHEAIVQISKPDNVWRDLDDSRQKDDFSWAKGDDKDKEWGYLFQPPNRGKKRQQCDWSMQQQNKKKDWDSSVSSQEKEGNTVDGEAQHPVEYEIKYGRKRPKHLSYYSFDSGYPGVDMCIFKS